MKILIIDDYLENVKFLSDILGKLGHQTFHIFSAKQATQAIDNKSPDLILIDSNIDEPDCYEATRNIRDYMGDKWIPIIIIYAQSETNSELQCYKSGADEYILKPINTDILSGKIKLLQRIITMKAVITLNSSELQDYHNDITTERELAKKTIENTVIIESVSNCKNINYWFHPNNIFSGDMLSIVHNDNGMMNVLLADSRGHGLSAALLQLPTAEIFYDMVKAGYNIHAIVREINKKLYPLKSHDYYLSALLMRVDLENNIIEYYNANMPNMLFFSKDGHLLKSIESNKPALGLTPDEKLDNKTSIFKFETTGSLLLYTDGLIKAENLMHHHFTEEGITNSALDVPFYESSHKLIENICAHCKDTRLKDDISFVVINSL